ncbi:hypothetical protein [Clostridioides difficile]|nr:hypothetical protein [Clostridioides difficile]
MNLSTGNQKVSRLKKKKSLKILKKLLKEFLCTLRKIRRLLDLFFC